MALKRERDSGKESTDRHILDNGIWETQRGLECLSTLKVTGSKDNSRTL